MRLFLALMTSAATAAFLFLLIETFATYPPPENAFSLAALGLFGLLFVAAALVAVVIGLPVFLIAKRFGRFDAWTSAIGGLAIGCLMSFAILTLGPKLVADPEQQPPTMFDFILSYVRYGGIGLFSGLVFWFVRGFRRQKKTPPSDVF